MRFKKKLLWAAAGLLIFASLASGAEGQGAVAASNARAQANSQAAASLGAGGGGTDLRAIAVPKQQQVRTLTGFPPGTLPGDNIGGGEGEAFNAAGKAVPSGRGEKLPPFIGPDMVGATLDHVWAIAAHVGYTVVRRADVPNSLDAFYRFDVLSGKSRKARLYFDRGMKVLWVEN